MQDNFRILRPFLRGLPIIILAMIISALAARKYLGYVTPMFESTAKLKLADINEGVPSSNLFKNLDVFASSNKIAAEIELLKSSVLVNKTLDSLDFDIEVARVGKIRTTELYHESPILVEAKIKNPKTLDRLFTVRVKSLEEYFITLPDADKSIKCRFGEVVPVNGGYVRILLNKTLINSKPDIDIIDHYQFRVLSRQKLIEQVTKNLDVISVDKDVAVIRIIYKSAVSEKAAVFANKLAQTYIGYYIETKAKAADTTVKFLENQIKEVSGRLSVSEDNIENYRDSNGVVNIRQETETDLRKVSQLKIQKTNDEMNLAAIRELYEYVKSGEVNFLELAPNYQAFTDLLSTEIVKGIKKLQADKRDLLLTYTPKDEKVLVIDRKIKDLTSYLIESIANTKKDREIKYKKLCDEIAEAEKVFLPVPQKEKKLNILNREFELFQESYRFLNEKKIEAQIAQAAKISFHSIIAPAVPSKAPVSPNKPVILLVSIILGMFGAIFLIYLVHLIKAKVNDPYTIEKNSSIPIAILTPNFEKFIEIERHFRKEAIQLGLKNIYTRHAVMVFSSQTNAEGRSFHIYQLSRSFARQGIKVLLIDINGNLALNYGIHNLSDQIEVSNKENISYLDFSHLKYIHHSTSTLAPFIQDLKKSFDVILINNEPLETDMYGLLTMSVADANLFIVDSRRTPAKMLNRLDLLREEYDIPNLWYILNKAGYNPSLFKQMLHNFRLASIQFKKFKNRF